MQNNSNGASPRLSAARIKVSRKPAPTLFERLQVLAANSGTNRNDQVIALVTACIGESIDTTKHICEVLARLGFKPAHVAMILKTNTGGNPERHLWSKDEAGRYRLLG